MLQEKRRRRTLKSFTLGSAEAGRSESESINVRDESMKVKKSLALLGMVIQGPNHSAWQTKAGGY